MKYVCLRDDDVNFFTRRRHLEAVYAPALEKRIPVNFSVIPQVWADTALERSDIYLEKEGLVHSPFIPPEFRGRHLAYEIGTNVELIDFLVSLDWCEFAQHGFNHGFSSGAKEFESDRKEDITKRIVQGKQIIEKSFGKNQRFFVAPWDRINKSSLSIVKRFFKGISLHDLGLSMLPVWYRWEFLKFRRENRKYLFWGDFLILEHPGYIINRFRNEEDMVNGINQALEKNNILVLVTHHWEFFFDWGKEETRFLSVWHKILKGLIDNPDVEFLTFSKLYERLRTR